MESNQLQIREINQSILMSDARADLTGRWGVGVAIALVYTVMNIVIAFVPYISSIVSILFSGPLSLGVVMMGLGFANRSEVEVSTLFDGFKNFGNALGLSLLMSLGIGLGFICLIVPGVILALGWGMSMFILAENPNRRVVDVLLSLIHISEPTRPY